jgi:DNA-binding protein HU-beta
LSRKNTPVRVWRWRNPINREERSDVTKQEFVDQVASKTNMSRREAAEAVDAVLDSITETLTGGGEINFTGFGKFSTQHRKERQGVNPRNPSEKVTIPAATVPKFSAGSSLKQAVKTGGGDGMGGGF